MIYKAKFKITTDVNEKSQILIVKRWLIILISLFTFSIICFLFIVFLFVNTPDKSKFHQEGQILFSLIFLSITTLILVLMSFPQILYGIPVGKAGWIMRNEDDIEDDRALAFESATHRTQAENRKQLLGLKVAPPKTLREVTRILNNYTCWLKVMFGSNCPYY
jgi:hypothetical protein